MRLDIEPEVRLSLQKPFPSKHQELSLSLSLNASCVLYDYFSIFQDARVRQIPILWELGTIRPGNTLDLPVGTVPGTYKIQAVESHNIVFHFKVVYNTKVQVCSLEALPTPWVWWNILIHGPFFY